MIISQKHQLAFVHVPKCGGSSVREQIEKLHDFPAPFRALMNHPDLGRIHRAHLPLWAVREHFPNAFELLCEYDVYALVRDPFSRFRSAVAEIFRVNVGKEISHARNGEVRSEIASIIDTLSNTSNLVDAKYCHFIRQSDFVCLESQRIANRLRPIGRMPEMLNEIGVKSEIKIVPSFHRRETLDFRFHQSEKILRKSARLAYKYLPLSSYTRVQHMARRLFTRSRKGGPHDEAFAAPEINNFILEYYSQDFVLWKLLSSPPIRETCSTA